MILIPQYIHYSLMKMLYAFMASSDKKLTWRQLKHSILRNFGGLKNVTPVEIFRTHVSLLMDQNEKVKYYFERRKKFNVISILAGLIDD